MTKTNLVKSAGRFGPRYGISVRRRIASIEAVQKRKQKCIFCNGQAKRLSKGIWLCKKCGKKFAGHTYYLSNEVQKMSTENAVKSKPLKKEKPTTSVKETAKKTKKIEDKK